jgi:hypothetical protein
MLKNSFQKALLKNKDAAWEIIKVFHPDILEEYKDRLKIYLKYDWVCIELKAQKNISVSIGVTFQCNLYSGNKPLHLFEKELKNNSFKAWRFYDDSKSIIGIVPDNEVNMYNDKVNNILNRYNIPKPTAKQMSDYYHSD